MKKRYPFSALLVTAVLIGVACRASSSDLQNDPLLAQARQMVQSGLHVPATNALFQANYSAQVTAQGRSEVASVQISNNVGTISFGSEAMSTFIEEVIPNAFSHDLYQGIAVSPGRFTAYWMYCHAGQIDGIYYESADGNGMKFESASGSCSYTATATQTALSLPESAFAPGAGVAGFAIEGDDIYRQSGGVGIFKDSSGQSHAFFPFSSVDCTQCAAQGWYELHSLIWDDSSDRMCFAIFYLYVGQSNIMSAYSICQPDLQRPYDQIVFSGTWTK
jgi:hypothetical protein